MRLKIFKNKILIFSLIACIFASVSLALVRAIFPRKYYNNIVSVCDGTSIDPNLVLAIIKTESSFNNDKISPKGAIGLMQIMPETATYVSDLFFAGEQIDIEKENENILVGVTYLIYLFNKFKDKKTALAAYNAGEGRVYEWLENKDYSLDGKSLYFIPFKETSSYVEKVIRREKIYNLLY